MNIWEIICDLARPAVFKARPLNSSITSLNLLGPCGDECSVKSKESPS